MWASHTCTHPHTALKPPNTMIFLYSMMIGDLMTRQILTHPRNLGLILFTNPKDRSNSKFWHDCPTTLCVTCSKVFLPFYPQLASREASRIHRLQVQSLQFAPRISKSSTIYENIKVLCSNLFMESRVWKFDLIPLMQLPYLSAFSIEKETCLSPFFH